nr:MAG TPA: crystallin beta/gamma motif-containing protein [Caudoviricetes sp.]
MGTFNFSNMQGGQQQETQNIPREFRPAVEQAKTEPVGSYGNNKTGFWDGVKNFFSGADVDTGAGFIDETGTWNNGTKQELAKYYPTQKSAEELEKDRLGSLWDRAYKKYHYSKDDVLLEAKKISAATNIPENAILANADNLANARNVYNYQQKAMDPQEVFKAYPELSELAKLSDTDAAIALHNLKNVRQTQGIIEAAKTGWELDNLMSERGRMGYAAMNGKELTDADIARLGEIEKAQKNSKELPGLFEDPMSAIVGGTVQSGKMMLRNALNGQKMGVYGAGFGALLGGIAGGGATLGAGAAAGAAAGAKIGYSVGSRIGMAQDMYDEIAGNNYLDYKGYKDKQGRQLLTDNQARSYAAVAAALETGIEFSNADKILSVIKGGAGAQSIKEIISSAKDSTELQSLLAAYLRDSAKNIGTVAISESAEEGVQEMSNRIISDIAAANNPGGDIPTYTAKDVIVGGLEASWQALPASIGFGAGAHGASTVSFMRRASAALQLKSEEQKANLRDANGISMLRSLAEDIKNNALFKKAPEVYNEVLNNQLKGTELETINIDTEYVLNQQGGYELLKSAAKAAGIGEQYLKDIIDTKADLKISTADYVSKLLPTEIGAHLEDYITFSDISECLARNREYAGRMRREMDRILAYENRQREDALNTYLDNNFHTPETREIAEAVLRRFPDNPKEGVKEIRKSLQAKIDEPLNQIIEELEKGMGNGVAVVEIPEYDNQMRGRGIKVSNNDPWYQRYYKENKHKPSKMELRELAREIWTGHNEYGLFGWENRTPEDNQWYENNKAAMEATEEAIRRLDALTPALEKIDPGELSITEGLSEEGFEVYRKLRGKLEGAESKEVRQAAQMSAILAARMADRMAELHRQVGHTKYTALDYARSIGLIRSESEAAEQKFNQAAMRKENKRYVLNEDGNVDWGNVNELVADDGTTIKKAPVRMQIGYQVGAGDAGAGYIHIKNRHTGFIEGKGYKNVSDIVYDVLENADFAIKSISADGRERIALIRDLTPHTSILLALDYTEEGDDSYYTIVSIMPQSKKQTKEAKEKALSFDGSVRPSPATGSGAFFTPTETKAGIEGGSFAGKDNAFDTVSLSDADQYVNEYTYDQKAWHGTPYNFERFDIGKIGDGVGDQVHGWGLYFAKDRKISEAYKEVLGADAGAVIVDGVTYKIDEEGDWATAAGQKLIDNDPLEFVLDTFDAMSGNKNKESAIKSLKERIAGTKRTANTESYIAKLEEAINIIEKADVKYENTSRLLKVEVPENDVLLDEQKTFVNQNKNVQALLKNTIESLDDARSMKFWENLLNFKLRAFDNAGKVQFKIDGFNKLADGIGKILESNSNTFGYRTLARSLERYGYSKEEIEKLKSDGEYRNQEQQKLRSQAAALEEELERAKAEDAAAKEEVINQAKADISGTLGGMFSGNKIYDALAKAMGEEDYNWRGASELLNEHGIKGIAYEGMKDGRCFVVFDDKAVDIIERYNQSAAGRSYSMDSDQRGLWQLKGQTAFKTTGEKVISLFKAADQSTFMHEMAHIYLHDMLALAELPNAPKQLLDDVATINQWAAWNDTQFVKEYKGTAMESEFKKLNEQMKTAVAKGSVEIEGKKMTLEQMQRLWMQERFARGFENYLKSGDAPTEATRSIFRRFKQWLTKIYRAFSQIGGAPSQEVKAVMDRMVASEDEIDIAMRKKGVDDFAESGGMDYLEGSAGDVYRRMVERAKADAEEKVLKIALKDVKKDYRQQEKELFAREEAEYRDKLAAEPVFIIQEHIKNNPDISRSDICERLGMDVEDYVKQLKEYGSLDAAVKAHMEEFKEGIDNSGIDAQYFRERAEEVVQESKYRKLATAMELEAFERIAKKQRNLTTQIEAEGKNDAAEKGVIKTVDKMTRQSKQIEELTAETKGLKQDKRELLANVRGLRDAALSHYKDYVQFVEMKLEVMPIEDANNYQMWRRKSAQAQYNSEQSLIKGNWDKAVKYKQAQLIYDMFADRAVRNAKQIKKIEDGLKRKQQTISKAKNISADERYAYNHLMYVFGFSDADAPVPPHYEGIMEVLMKADATREEGGLMLESPFFGPDGQTNLPEWFLQAAMNSNKRKAGHKDLSNMQVDLVAQVMHIIYKRGMDNMKLATIKTKDGRTLTVDEAVAEIEGQTRQRMIERANADPTGANKNRWQDDAANFIDQADMVLIKPEVELKKLGDVALRYIYDPLKEAADKELKMAVNMQNKLKRLFDAYSPKELADMRNKRLYDFGSSKITKEQAIMIALNWGTETNQQRVLDGYHVNVAQVKNVLQYLDERDWNLVNSIWKLYDIHWDQIREIEARMTGAVLQKQEAKGFVVVGQDRKIYTLDGGYFPIKYDLRDLRTQEQADAAQQSAMSNIAMSMGKGFLKERTQHKVERRLDLRFEVISGSITDVIHLVAFREPVRDVRRIVLNENFKNLVYNYLGQNAYKNLKKWTSDCWAEEPIPRTAYEKGMAKLRNAQTMGTMGFRVTTALLNIANVPSVAHYMGAAELLHSLKKFYSAPRRYTDFVFQRSVFMAERAETMDASIHDALKGPNILDGIPGIWKAGEVIKNNAFKMITWTDLMLALPLWQHEYEKTYNAEMDAGRSPQQAREAGVNAGDAAVRWCFGSGRTVDKAAIQRKGSELMKQLTMYYSYNSTVYNALNYKLWEAKVGYKKAVAASAKNKSMALMKAVAHAGDALLMWVLLPAVISALLRAGASGDDDDWKIEKLIKSMGQESLTGIVGGIPVLRDAVPYFMAKVFDEHQFAPKIPIQNTIEQTNRVIQSAVSDKKTISDTLREMGKLTSQVTGAPSTLIDSFTTTLQYLESGFDESVADYLRALIFDKKLKKNQK